MSGVLRPAVTAYLEGEDTTPEHIAAMRAYLRQWIEAPAWRGFIVDDLRRLARSLVNDLIDRAVREGTDPL